MQGIFYAQSQKIFLTEGILARWLTECYCRTADHGYDVMITQYLFLLLSRTISNKLQRQRTSKYVIVIVQNKSTTVLYGLYFYRQWKWRQNANNVSMKPLDRGSWFHLNFDHFEVILAMVDESTIC